MGASELGAGLACEHGTRSECQPLEWDRECQGLTGPRAATGGGGGAARAQPPHRLRAQERVQERLVACVLLEQEK